MRHKPDPFHHIPEPLLLIDDGDAGLLVFQVDVFVVVMDHVDLERRLALEDHAVYLHRTIGTQNLCGEGG